MKYPLLTVPYLPNLYKHCAKVYMVHIEFKNIGFLNDGNVLQKESYLTHIQKKMYALIEDYYIINMATRVSSNGHTFVIFKETLPKKQFLSFIENLMGEISVYTNHGIEIYHRTLRVMLFETDRVIKLFAMKQAGDEVLASMQWKEAVQLYRYRNNHKGKYLQTYDEYVALHPIQQTNAKHTHNRQIPLMSHPNDDYVYYI